MVKRYSVLNLSLLFIAGLCLTIMLTNAHFHGINFATKSPSPVPVNVLHFGHQPQGSPLLLKARGNLEKRLASMGISVEWTEFSAGRLITKAMEEGKIDIGQAGGVPCLFAQADGVPFVYVANQTSLPQKLAVLVPANSSIQTLADLKGKKIAFTKSSSAHYFITQALLKVGLTVEDIQAVYLLPPDGQAAFERKEVDAWVVWDPFQALIAEKMPVRVLTTAEGLAEDINFFIADRDFANKHSELVKIVIDELQQVGFWAQQNPDEATKIIARHVGMKLSTAKKISKRTVYNDIQSIQDRAIEEQQRMANTFFRLRLLPKQIWVEDAVWKWGLRI